MTDLWGERIREIDISMDENLLGQHKIKLRESSAFQRILEETGQDLEQTISYYASFRDIGEGEQIPVSEYLRRHPEILQEHSVREVRRYGEVWIENSRCNSDSERKFCKQARGFYGGKFGEIFQSVFVNRDRANRKYLAFSGKANGVDEKDIKKSIPAGDLESLKEESELVVLVHNHPDFYRDSVVFERVGDHELGESYSESSETESS